MENIDFSNISFVFFRLYRDTLRNIKSTTVKLQDMNKQMVTLTQKGERNEKLEEYVQLIY